MIPTRRKLVPVPCPYCGGEGHFRPKYDSLAGVRCRKRQCDACRGTGYVERSITVVDDDYVKAHPRKRHRRQTAKEN